MGRLELPRMTRGRKPPVKADNARINWWFQSGSIHITRNLWKKSVDNLFFPSSPMAEE